MYGMLSCLARNLFSPHLTCPFGSRKCVYVSVNPLFKAANPSRHETRRLFRPRIKSAFDKISPTQASDNILIFLLRFPSMCHTTPRLLPRFMLVALNIVSFFFLLMGFVSVLSCTSCCLTARKKTNGIFFGSGHLSSYPLFSHIEVSFRNYAPIGRQFYHPKS